MHYKNARLLFAFAMLATPLIVSTLTSAQNITCSSGTSCKKNFVPLFNSTGGAATVKDSIIKQSSGNINVNGGVTAIKGGSANLNVIVGSNTSGPFPRSGAGVFGQISTTGESNMGLTWNNGGGGAWGDGGADNNYGVIGTSDGKVAGIFENNSKEAYAIYGFNKATGGLGNLFAVFNGDAKGCAINALGDITCTGVKSAVVPIDGGKQQVALSAIESPKNWFEDFGSEQLSGGVAVVRLDSKFTQTVNTKQEYHVFLTPKGDCKGLYVANENSSSFEVHELGGGNSSVRFDYRITALRKNYEKVRFADRSREFPGSRDGRIRPATQH